MNICIAQIKPEKGNISNNIQHHLRFIERAVELKADLIVFPELSITNYEPTLAKELATETTSDIFNPFQNLSNKNDIAVGIGVPTIANDGINISMLIFCPYQDRMVYSKGLLHPDELTFFVSSNNQPFLNIKGKRVALGICYETLQRAHFFEAKQNNADVFIASVAKPDRGTNKAFIHFPSMARAFKIPILMCNAVGPSDDFIANGLSSVWNNKGDLLDQLDNKSQGILMYNTETEEALTVYNNLNS